MTVLEDTIRKIEEWKKRGYTSLYNHDLRKTIDDALLILKEYQKDYPYIRRWVPVSKGLPENFVETIVTDGEDVGIAALQGFMDDEVVWCNAYGMDYIDDPEDEDYLPITHWMEKPKPPKKEDESDD